MSDIVVKDNVRYRGKDAERLDIVVPVQVGVPIEGTEAWAEAEATKAREELQAELAATRERATADLDAELASRRAAFDAEIEAARAAAASAADQTGEQADTSAETKVDEPEVKKVREPAITKSRTGDSK